MPLSAGDKLGPYQIRSLIGAGGMGEVRLASAARLGGPNAPGNPCPDRESTTRHGVIPTKTREFAGA